MAAHAGVIAAGPIVHNQLAGGEYPYADTGDGGYWTVAMGVLPTTALVGALTNNPVPIVTGLAHAAVIAAGWGDLWYDKIHVIPSSIAFGNVLSNQQRTIEIFNSYLTGKDFTDFTNNAGQGVNITNLPSFPYEIDGFSSILLTLQVSTIGPPTIAGDLVFETEVRDASVLLTGRRVILMPVRPQFPVVEVLEYLTDIMESRNGTEQRIQVADVCRQLISLSFFEDDPEGSNLRMLLFDWLPRVWGVPCWWEERNLTADVTPGLQTIQVSTTFCDLRVGGLAVVYTDQFDAEALEVQSFDASSVTFTSPLERAHLASNSTFMPVRIAYADQQPRGSQLLQGQQKLSMDFETIDGVDNSSAAAFPTFNSKVLLDEHSLVPGGGQVAQGWQRKVKQLGSPAGRRRLFADNDRSRLSTLKGFFINTPQRLWEVRQLFHQLRGSLTSFYLPSFRNDLVVTANIAGGGTGVTIKNVGFATFVGQRQPFAAVRLVLNDGTTFTRTINASSVVSPTAEQITVSSSFSGSLITVAQIKRLELLMLVRCKDDRITFEHRRPGRATGTMEVITVKE